MTFFLCGGNAEGLGGGILRGAEVAVTTGTKAVGGVAEVLNERGHAALRRLGELDHAVYLSTAEADLLVVAFAPCCLSWSIFRGANVAGHVNSGCTLGDEFLYSFVEGFGFHLQTLTEEIGHLEVAGEEGGYTGELGDGGVVALEEEVVHLAVGERVQEHGTGGLAVASGATDLLVELLNGAG